MTALVLVSNLGGGIARHLDLTRSVRPLSVVELPENLSLPDKVRQVRGLLREPDHTAVITHGVAAGLAVRLSHDARRLRHTEFWHGDPFFNSGRRRSLYRALARVGRVPAQQVFTHEWLRTVYRAAGSKTEVLPNAVPVPAQTPPPAASPHMTYVGRLSAEKGYADLLAAWVASSAAEAGWVLEIHGDGPLETLPLPTGAHAFGHSPTPLVAMTAGRLVVVPSRTETGPYVALEAASLARPIIGTRVGDMPDLLASGGLLSRPSDVPDLTDAIGRAVRLSSEDLQHIGRQGHAWLVANRPFDQWQARVAGMYDAG